MELYFQSMFLNQFANGAKILLYAVFLAGIFVALIFRPQNVRSRELVLASIVFFAAAFIAPNVLLQSTMAKDTNTAMMPTPTATASDSNTTAIRWSIVVGPILFGLAAILGTLGLLPSRMQLAVYQEDEFRRRAREEEPLELRE